VRQRWRARVVAADGGADGGAHGGSGDGYSIDDLIDPFHDPIDPVNPEQLDAACT